MAGSYRFAMDQKDIVRLLLDAVDDFARDRLMDKEQRSQQKEQCAERLAAEDGGSDREAEVRYSDQAVLANLDWGIEALEEAIDTSNMETKLARLDYAEKMLHVCALLNSKDKTAGVPNFYLSAWAHLNLCYLWKVHGDTRKSLLSVLEMFIVDPFFSRIDFAPELWKELFLPHMGSIVGWYSQERQNLMMDVVPDSSDFSFTADLDQFFNESLIFSLRPDQVERLQKLEQLYRESLDENTRLYAKYFKDCLNSDSNSNKKIVPMMPIAEPPMTPLHEVSRSIPEYVKFGPILPKSAGISAIINSRDDSIQASRKSVSSSPRKNLKKISRQDSLDCLLKEKEEDYKHNSNNADENSNESSPKLRSPSNRMVIRNDENGAKAEIPQVKHRVYTSTLFSSVKSPATSSPKITSPKMAVKSKKESPSVLRLLSCRITDPNLSSFPGSPQLGSDYSISSADSDGDLNETRARRSPPQSKSFAVGDEGSLIQASPSLSEKQNAAVRPPKDFVCPITSQIFNDPVTLETGQTYERKAIEEWLKRGNATCPITRQPLSARALPKTNYVLKRLITAWKEQHPDVAQDCSYSGTPINSFGSPCKEEITLPDTVRRTSDSPRNNDKFDSLNRRYQIFGSRTVTTSPTSVISLAAIEAIINGLKPLVSCISTSENLPECEAAVLAMAKLWMDGKGDPGVHAYLSEPAVVSGLLEILSNSINREVLRASIYVLSELIASDESVREILDSVDSDFDCLAMLLKNGLAEAAVLICQLRPAFAKLSGHDLTQTLIQIIQKKNDEKEDLQFVMEPKEAAIFLLEQILVGGDERSTSLNASGFVSANGIPALIKCLSFEDGRRSIISILVCCIQADKSCRSLIANRIELSPILELLHAGDDSEKGRCVNLLSELVQLNRRTLCNQILQIIREEGEFSTMHTLLAYLQMAPLEQQPATASLLLQLDLLVEPRKMSMYREESIDALIEALRRRDFSKFQRKALDLLLCLSGRVSSSGRSYTEAWLLKVAGFDQPYSSLMKAETARFTGGDQEEDEEEAINAWEKRVAFALCNHEKGSVFKALEECLKNNSLEMAKSCLVIATWLCYRLSTLPDTGLRDNARKSLLAEFINVLQSSNNIEEKILAALAVKTFIGDPVALEEVAVYAKSIYKTLRKLKRYSPVVGGIMKALINLPSVNATELWTYGEVFEIDSNTNGEILSLIHLKGLVLSSHSDGTIKVWDAGKRVFRLIREVRQHTKAVTCLYVPPTGDKLYSGSLDKTIRVWLIKDKEIECIKVHEVKDPVYDLIADAMGVCFISQGTGVKLYSWSGIIKHVSFNKQVKCLAIHGDKLYCGCSGDSIQEVDLFDNSSNTFYAGSRKLLRKQSIHCLHIHDGLLLAGGSSTDATGGKIFSLSTKAPVASFPTGIDIHHIAASGDFIFMAARDIIEVWLRERMTRVASIKTGSGGNAKITALASDKEGGMLLAGFSDGKIQVWALD